jgi:hypothetical protein
MKEIITMSRAEYNNQKDKIKEEVKLELDKEYHKFPFYEYIFTIVITSLMLPKVYLGHNEFPTLTSIALFLFIICLLITLIYLFISIKTHYEKIIKK